MRNRSSRRTRRVVRFQHQRRWIRPYFAKVWKGTETWKMIPGRKNKKSNIRTLYNGRQTWLKALQRDCVAAFKRRWRHPRSRTRAAERHDEGAAALQSMWDERQSPVGVSALLPRLDGGVDAPTPEERLIPLQKKGKTTKRRSGNIPAEKTRQRSLARGRGERAAKARDMLTGHRAVCASCRRCCCCALQLNQEVATQQRDISGKHSSGGSLCTPEPISGSQLAGS